MPIVRRLLARFGIGKYQRRITSRQFGLLIILALLALRTYSVWSASVVPRLQFHEGDCEVTDVLAHDRLRVHQIDERGKLASGDVQLYGLRFPQNEEIHRLADRFVREHIRDGRISLRFDRQQFNDKGVTSAYVFVGDECLNELLVRDGLAVPQLAVNDSPSMRRRLINAQEVARRNGVGLWGHPPAK